ncbi:MAG: PQQ-dependent sugar dehydrogenase [Terricaulis sp.]
MRTLVLALGVMLAACTGVEGQSAPTDAAAGAPWPSDPPNADGQTPAFPNQTRAPAIHSGITLNVEAVVSGLDHPWGIAFLPDRSILVTERPGRMRLVSAAGVLSEPIAGVLPVVAESQGGLLDVAISPDFASDRLVYWSFSEPRGGNRNATSVARGRLSEDGARLTDVRVIFRQEPAWASNNHFGSRLVWDRQGHLFVTLGERAEVDSRNLARSLDNDLGKVVRINADGSIPADNPLVGRANARGEIWSSGHRNVQGAALHPETGQLWTIEHGPRGGDELNAPKAGLNYGWPDVTYGEDYSGQPINEGITAREGVEQPIYYWDPVIAPSGMTFYQGQRFPWRGDVLIASLKGALVRLELDGERVTGEERLLTDVGRVRDVVEGPDGAIYVITDDDNGRLLRLTPR